MTTKTRYFVIVSLLVLGVGLGTGLVAYYVGFPAGAAQRAGGPEELQYIPHDATVIAFANVQDVMNSQLRQKLLQALPMHEAGQKEFENQTGINIETDIDRIVASLNPDPSNNNTPGQGLVLARGRFDEVKIEALMREHGAEIEQYKTKRLIVVTHTRDGAVADGRYPSESFAVSFVEPGFVALGHASLVRSAIDLHQGGNNPQTGLSSVTGNDELSKDDFKEVIDIKPFTILDIAAVKRNENSGAIFRAFMRHFVSVTRTRSTSCSTALPLWSLCRSRRASTMLRARRIHSGSARSSRRTASAASFHCRARH